MTALSIILCIMAYLIIGRVFTMVLISKQIVRDTMDVFLFWGTIFWPIAIGWLIIRGISNTFIKTLS
jgi:hypothetical protein